jgi:hypothetical protein
MAQGLEEAKAALTKVKDEYTLCYNHQHEPSPVFPPGDRVWLDRSNISTNRLSSTLSHQCLGPFVIEACVGYGTYCLTLPSCPSHILILSLANDLQYLVKWKGYDKSHNQWEVHTPLHAKPKIVQFHHIYPGAACHINVAIVNLIPFTRVDLATSWWSSHIVTPHFEGGVM